MINTQKKEEILDRALAWWRNSGIDKWDVAEKHPEWKGKGVEGIVEMYILSHREKIE